MGEEAVSRNQAMVSSLVLLGLASVTQAQEPSAASGLDEVVVTAQKRETNLQETPISWASICTSGLERRSAVAVYM